MKQADFGYMTEGGHMRWQDDPVRLRNVQLQQAAARGRTKLFCPDHQEQLPVELRGLDASVFDGIRNQITDILTKPDESFDLTSGQITFLTNYGRTVLRMQKEKVDPPLPKESISTRMLGASLYALQSRVAIRPEDDEVRRVLSATPAIATYAEQLRTNIGAIRQAIQAATASVERPAATIKKVGGAGSMPEALQGDLSIIAHSLKMQNWKEAHTFAVSLTKASHPKDALPLFLCAKAYARYILDAYEEDHARLRIKEQEKAQLLLEAFLMEAASKTSPQFEAAKTDARTLLGQIQNLTLTDLEARDKQTELKDAKEE